MFVLSRTDLFWGKVLAIQNELWELEGELSLAE